MRASCLYKFGLCSIRHSGFQKGHNKGSTGTRSYDSYFVRGGSGAFTKAYFYTVEAVTHISGPWEIHLDISCSSTPGDNSEWVDTATAIG